VQEEIDSDEEAADKEGDEKGDDDERRPRLRERARRGDDIMHD